MQIIENFRLRPDPRNYGTHEDIPQKVCDEVNDYNRNLEREEVAKELEDSESE